MAAPNLSLPLLVSVGAALATIGLKAGAYALTGSVGLLSDALESIVNLVAASAAFLSMRYSARPVDRSHTYGHEKIEFFASGLEGGLILVAALAIGWFALERLVHPHELEALGPGVGVSLLAAGINGAVGAWLVCLARQHRSIVLEADGKHLLTDVWTTAGVALGLGLVAWTGIRAIDSLVALVVAGNILWTGAGLLRRSFDGLMDAALPAAEQELVRTAIEAHLEENMDFHALRTRQAGARRFVDFHLLVPGALSVQDAHDRTGRIEDAIRAVLPGVEVTVHIEPIEERQSWEDSALLPLEQAVRRRPRPGVREQE
jgi:cation diffusion facilitator family transporter